MSDIPTPPESPGNDPSDATLQPPGGVPPSTIGARSDATSQSGPTPEFTAQLPIAGAWQPDPSGRFALRWWDGTRWSEAVQDAVGSQYTDPWHPSPTYSGSGQVTPPSPSAVSHQPPQGYAPQNQTPNFNLPGGGAWAAPQQMVVTNASKSPGLAIASLILGVGAFFFALIPFFGWFSIPFAIVGLGLGISGVLRANKGFEGRGMSIAGIVSSVSALFVSVVYFFALGAAVNDVSNELDDFNSDTSDGVCNEDRYWQDPDC